MTTVYRSHRPISDCHLLWSSPHASLLALLVALAGTVTLPARAQEDTTPTEEDQSDDPEDEDAASPTEAEGGETAANTVGEDVAKEDPSESDPQKVEDASHTEDTEEPPDSKAQEDSGAGDAEEEAQKTPLPRPPANEKAADEAASAALADAPSAEPSLLPLKLTTSTWSRFEVRENYDDLGVSRGRFSEGDFVVFRARLGMGTHPLPIGDGSDVMVQFTPQASGLWGINGTIGEANVGIYEGYFKIRTERLDVQVGRQKMAYGDDLLIGSLDWHQTARAFDGIRAHYKMDRGYLDLFATQVAEGFPDGGSTFLGGDDYFWGAYLGVGGYFDEDMDLDAYFLVQSDLRQEGLVEETSGTTYARDAAHLMTGGFRVKNQVSWFDYRLEAGIQFGSEAGQAPDGFMGDEIEAIESLAYQADLELGVSFPGKMRLALGGLVASGDDPETERNEGFNHLYPTGHKFLGLMDVFGARTNVASGNLKLMRPITKSLDVRIDGHVFFRLEDGAATSPEPEAGFAGTEIDAQLKQALGKFASVRGLYGIYIPTSGHYQNDDVAHYVEVQSGVNF